jgi:hypothetical protein
MFKMRVCVLSISLLVVAIAQAGDSVDPVLTQLDQVDIFAFGRVGYAGVISQGEKDYRMILSRPSALADFEKVFALGTLQGKSYALTGIWKLSVSRFRELSQPLRGSSETVVTESGCIIHHERISTILKRIETGAYSN